MVNCSESLGSMTSLLMIVDILILVTGNKSQTITPSDVINDLIEKKEEKKKCCGFAFVLESKVSFTERLRVFDRVHENLMKTLSWLHCRKCSIHCFCPSALQHCSIFCLFAGDN